MARLVFASVACSALFFWDQDRPTFRLAARTVYIYATVQGSDGRLVTDLARDDFEVFDNNNPQAITVFDNDPQKITVAVMFDMSNSMAREHPRIRAAAIALVQALWPDDRARIGSFGMEVAISPFITSDKPTLLRVIARTGPAAGLRGRAGSQAPAHTRPGRSPARARGADGRQVCPGETRRRSRGDQAGRRLTSPLAGCGTHDALNESVHGSRFIVQGSLGSGFMVQGC